MMRDCCLGIDTSCYTASVACVSDNSIVFSERTMLSVPFGDRGLRQSEALFQQIKLLTPLIEHLFQQVDHNRIGVICVSNRPTSDADSYMPVFLAGFQMARSIAAALGIPLIETNHQCGHIRAALVGNEDLLGREFYAFHLSGGTTDLVKVNCRMEQPYEIKLIGTSKDLHCGQFVDRIGVALGLPFPAGKNLESLAIRANHKNVKFASSVRNGNCSFSGPESSAIRLIGKSEHEEIAFGVYDCISRTVAKMLSSAEKQYGHLPILLCGGVASSILLRELLHRKMGGGLRFGKSELSSDNAVGVAFIGEERRRSWKN